MALMPESRFVVLGQIVGTSLSQDTTKLRRRAEKLAKQHKARVRVELWKEVLVAEPPDRGE